MRCHHASPRRTRAWPTRARGIRLQDCNLVLYDNGGTEFKDAIYYSATYGQGTPPCALTVSGAGGGFISVSDSTYTALYVQPPGFQVRLALTPEVVRPWLKLYWNATTLGLDSMYWDAQPEYKDPEDASSRKTVRNVGSFQVLLDGYLNYTYVPGEPNPRQAYQVYDADSGSAAVTTTSPSLNQATARVLLPTTNTVLAYGYSGGIPVNGAPAGAEVFSPR